MVIVKKENLEIYVQSFFKNVGLSELDSKRVSESLVLSNLRGIDSHGILRVPIYIKRIQAELIQPIGETTFSQVDKNFLIADGQNRLGQIVAYDATVKLAETAQETTLSAMLVKNSNHFGQAAEYSMMLAEKGLIGIVMSNSVPLMPAIGGAEKLIGNNPISVSVFSETFGFITLDMALSQAAQGKVRLALERNSEVPVGWGTNSRGENTTDPSEILEGGFLLPVGGPKGFGMALFVEVLTAALADMKIGEQISSIYQLEKEANVAHFMIAINPKKVIEKELFQSRLDILINSIKKSSVASGIEKIYLPGELEQQSLKDRSENGIPIDEKVYHELIELGKSLNINDELKVE